MTDAPGDAPGPPRKGPAAFRTISEASTELGVPQHVLRFWETKFAFVRPMKRAGGRRFYRPQDLDVLRGVRVLLQEDGYTIKGVQKLHKEQGLKRLVTASGVGDAAAARLAAELEAEVAEAATEAKPRAPPSVQPTSAPAREEPPPAGPVEALDGAGTADLFGAPLEAAQSPPPEPEPRPDGAASSRPVLDTAARRRLAEVLSDLEATKAGIDALLREP